MIAVPGAVRRRPGGGVAVRLRAVAAEQAILAALAGAFVLMTVVTWRKWGVPEVDAGAELTTAAQLADGAVPYRDVRYFYGPLGLYLLGGAFRVFGTSLTVAFGFGLVQAAAVLTTFHVLARRWLPPLWAGLATLVLLAIGFSGTAYNFVLPHTNSATIGLLCLLGMLLALSSRRPVVAGVLLGMAALTRPEFAAVAAGAALAHLAGLRRDGDRTVLRAAICIGLPATAIGCGVLGAFAAVAGPERLFLENLWPVDFIREAGFATQSYWMPFTPSSALALLARGAAYLGPLLAIVVALDRAAHREGLLARARAAVAPLAIAGIGLAMLFGGWHLTGIAAADLAQVTSEVTRLVVVMSWLPLLALAAAAYAAWCFARRREAPLTGSWAIDLPLLVAAAALGLRAYNAFTDERSYAPYYAAPMVLLLAVLHMRMEQRWPAARPASLGALGLCAAALAAYAVVGLYADDSATVRSPRGTYVTHSAAGPGVQAALDSIGRGSADGERILAAPGEGGLYFLSGRDPALYEVMLLPGLLDTVDDELDAIRRLQDGDVRLAVVGARDLSAYGHGTFGADFNRVLGRHLAGAVSQRKVGDFADPVGGSYAARGYTILQLPR